MTWFGHGLDLTAFFDDDTVARGAPPYDPRLMVKLLIYGLWVSAVVLAQ